MTKKEQLLQTTLRLISEQGILATPMSQIVTESGVATGTVYHHFKSKEEIINFLYVREKMFFDAISEENISENDDYFENLNRLINAICDYYLENKIVFQFFQQVVNTTYITAESRMKAAESYSKIAKFIEEGITQNLIETNNVMFLLEIIHSNIAIYIEMVFNLKIIDTENRNQLNNYILKALKK